MDFMGSAIALGNPFLAIYIAMSINSTSAIKSSHGFHPAFSVVLVSGVEGEAEFRPATLG